MTLPRAYDLMEAWGKSPPTHWMIASYLGLAGKTPKKTEQKSEQDWEALASAMGTTITRKTSDGPE